MCPGRSSETDSHAKGGQALIILLAIPINKILNVFFPTNTSVNVIINLLALGLGLYDWLSPEDGESKQQHSNNKCMGEMLPAPLPWYNFVSMPELY